MKLNKIYLTMFMRIIFIFIYVPKELGVGNGVFIITITVYKSCDIKGHYITYELHIIYTFNLNLNALGTN